VGAPMLIESKRFEVVREAETAEVRQAIYRFRYTVWVKERGWSSVAGIDPFADMVTTPDDEGEGVTHFYTGSVYGADLDSSARLRTWAPGELPDTVREFYSLDRLVQARGAGALKVAELGCVVAHPESRRKANLPVASLFRAAFQVCLDADVDLLVFALHPGMVAAAARVFGARRYGAALRDDHSGPLRPLVVVPSDTDHHERVGSLFAGPAWKHFVLGRRPCVDLGPLTPCFVERDERAFSPDARWADYEERFFRRGVDRWSFFEGLRPGVTEELMARGELREVEIGTRLLDDEEEPREMFVVIEGCFEVLVGDRAVDVAGKGELIGEVSVLSPGGERTASVQALTPAKVLALDDAALCALNSGDPEAGYLVMINLARFIAERFRERARLVGRLEREIRDLREPED